MSRSTGAISHTASGTTHPYAPVTPRSPVTRLAHYSGTPMSSYPLAQPTAHLERRTKIIATVGPASWDLCVLEQLTAAGADLFRLNFSPAGPDKHAQTIETIRKASDALGREVAILGDLPGPKLRIGNLRDD